MSSQQVWAELVDARRRLGELNVLLHEADHRAKNILQIGVSILAMQARTVSDPVAHDALESAGRRLAVLAHAHALPDGDGDGRAAAHEQLVRICAAHRPEGRTARIRVELDAERLYLARERVATLGLVASELVANALKHAFPGGRRGCVRVSLAPIDDHAAQLVVEDNGIGRDGARPPGLGTLLIEALAHQLDGELQLTSAPGLGCRTQLTFAR